MDPWLDEPPVAGQDSHRGGAVEQLVFGTREGSVIDDCVSRFYVAHVGSPVAEVPFRSTSLGVVTTSEAGIYQLTPDARRARRRRRRCRGVPPACGTATRAWPPA